MPTAKKQLKLGAYLSPGGHQAGWRHPDASPNALMDFELVAHMATTAERGKMDAVFFPDSAGMAGSTELDNGNLGRARRGRCVYIEPATLLAGIAARLEYETNMPIILWFLGVPLVLVVLLMLTHVI